MNRSALGAALLAALALLTACASSSDSALCICAAGEKFDGEQCLAAADFVAPTCTPDDVAVCGCDEAAYSSACAAYTAGVEVKYGGPCRAATGGGGGGFGW
jgi:hypothetical protein